MSPDNNNRGGRGILAIIVTLIALVLAFLVGRLTAAKEAPAEHAEEKPDAPEILQKVEEIFKEGAKDKQWTEDEDTRYLLAVTRLSHAGQLHELSRFVKAINSGELHLARDTTPPPPPPCCNVCTGSTSSSTDKTPDKTPGKAGSTAKPAQPK
jgi:hypothetical protein